jgi:alpha-D-ribose 1-methylphosphonate 5-triphosphate synthase subunit PhnH
MRSMGIDPVHDTRETFRALLDATSRPGTVERVPTGPADRAVVATLVDHEVTVHTPDDRLREELSARGRLSTAPPEEAAVVHARGSPAWDVRDLSRGTLVEPSGGATVLYRVETLAPDADAGTTVRLSGPGVPGERRLGVGLPAAELRALAAAQADYPRGVDATFAAGDRLAAVPRSATLAVVD